MPVTNLKEFPDFPKAPQRPDWDGPFSREVLREGGFSTNLIGD
jgi:hypothetical protein